MGKIVERKRKKKKGRPSLLDIQKRSLIEEKQQQQQQQQKQNPIPNFKTTTRRNPNPEGTSPEEDHTHTSDAGEEDELNGIRRENKKLNLVVPKLPSQRFTPLNSGSDSDNHNKRKFNAIADESGNEKAEKHVAASNPMDGLPGGQSELDMGPSTPLPDKKLLLFILDRLQKKDTYAVFSEPVDPDELPDYHEIVDHPMDFGTVRKNLADGAYANLEQFQKDIFLICSNAMQYNSPDTIYFRQARSIQELAKKDFENLRKDSDDDEPECKIVRRGRPPTKNLRKQMVSPLGRAGSEFSSDATLATGTEKATLSKYDLRKAPVLVKSDPADIPGGSFHGSHDSEAYSGSLLKGNWMKQGKKQVVQDGSRRNTYNQPHLPAGGRKPPVSTTFCGERKQLLAVGLQQEYGYARSLAFFAANLGSIAWNFASKKIESSLPPGVKFDHGWVGENEEAQRRSLLFPSPPVQLSPSEPFPMPENSSAAPSSVEIKCEKSSEVSERENFPEQCMPSTPLPPSSSIPLIANRSPEFMAGRAEAVRGMNSQSGSSVPSSRVGMVRPLPPLQTHQNPVLHPRINGFNGAYGFSLPAHMGN